MRESQAHAGSQLGSPSAFFLSHMLFILPQGVIDLEALGKKGYSVPKAGTIQVVSHSLDCSSTLWKELDGLWLPCLWGICSVTF